MSNAIILFKNEDSDKWTKLKTILFDARRGTIEELTLGTHSVTLNHRAQGHCLLLTHSDTRVALSPTGGNEPDEEDEKIVLGDIPVVSHYDFIEEQKVYRIYHNHSRNEIE